MTRGRRRPTRQVDLSEAIAAACATALVPDWLLARAQQAGYSAPDGSEARRAVGVAMPPRLRVVPAADVTMIREAAGIKGLPPWKACPAGGDQGHEWDGVDDLEDEDDEEE